MTVDRSTSEYMGRCCKIFEFSLQRSDGLWRVDPGQIQLNDSRSLYAINRRLGI